MAPFPATFILDTSAVILLIQQGIIAGPGACFSFVTSAELYAGACKSHHPMREVKRIERTLIAAAILFPTYQTIGIYADLWAQLEHSGQRIPTNDLWIAASAIEWGLPLHARDEHFLRVPGLNCVQV